MKKSLVLAIVTAALTSLACLFLLSWNVYVQWTVDPLRYISRFMKSKSRILIRVPMTETVPKKPTRFLYMLQTESCLSEYLKEVIGDPSICPCDVLVLSYKLKCNQPPPPNVTYIYTGTRTSWGGGRNVLYEKAMKREQVYLYFIIMDDDITINRVDDESKSNPWRRFEEFLERVEPAAAAIDIVDKLWLRRAANGREKLGCSWSIDESAEYLSVARYDAAFNAFHNETVRHILPYSSTFDHISWIFAPMYLNIKIELMYAGHSVLHNKIFATNPTHRPYPKRWPNTREWQTIVDEAASELPAKYQNSTLLQGWRKYGIYHEQTSPTVCLPPPPPKMPIRQFAYLDGVLPGTNERSYMLL